jgi:hypothetical protein
MDEKILVAKEVVKEEIFEPVLGELVSDDSFAFTLLSCHC